jgi:hypothetical protein
MLGPARSSVKVGLVEAGEICTMSLSAYTLDAGIDEPEQ